MTKDWIGNSKSAYSTLGSSQHSNDERQEHDYYATEPRAVDMLCNLEKFNPSIWEPACGEGHISKALINNGYDVVSTDLIDRGYGGSPLDFLSCSTPWKGDIITNPPYKFAKEFVYKALSLINNGSKVAMFLKIQFMEGKGRKSLFQEHPPKTIYISSSRLNCGKNGDFEGLRISGGSAIAYAWWVWEKGNNEDTRLKWFN